MPTLSTIGAACARAWGFTSGLVKDQYFNLVSLLLPGNGTNGAQNNTFLDSSTNNFTITRNGNTTQGTFSPFSQTGWGNYFDGSGDYLSVSSNAAFGFGTGDFTIEYWIYPSLTGDGNQVVIDARSSSSAIPWLIGQTTGGAVRYYDGTTIRTGGTMTANTWNHVAWCRASNVNNVYLNGTSVSTYTASQDFGSSNPLTLGSNINTATERTTGYISNLRIVKGTAVYTANFTPPTTPLTAISGTSLLTCQSNRFKDSSSNAFTITSSGGPTVVAFSPFAPTAAYTTAAVGGSGYFDGTGDYLTVPSNAAFDFSTGDFTVECWVYMTQYNAGNYEPIFNNAYLFYISSSGAVLIFNGSSDVVTGSSGDVPLNSWNHIAFVRNGSATNNTKIYVNGVQKAQGTVTAAIGSASPNAIGQNSTVYFPGYISNVRVVKGTAVYTSAFTPPTAPLTAVSGTSLLLNFTNAGITDATAKNDLETVGNAQISTSVSKFGGGSMSFDGTGDYLYKPYDPLLNQLNGNFTIECWIYPTVTSTSMLFAGSANAAGSTNWYFEISATNKLRFVWDSTTASFAAVSTGNISANVWTYVAAVKNGGTITLYINGSADGTSSPTGTFKNGSFGTAIGRAGEYNGQYFTGYIDDFRMTIGQARTITASPSAPFPVQ